MSGVTDPAMLELFREEVRGHAGTLAAGLLELEADPANPRRIEPLMRAAHSLKGAARIVGIDLAVRLAHVMEDALVAAQAGTVRITPADVDLLLRGTDVLAGLASVEGSNFAAWEAANAAAVDELEPPLTAVAAGSPAPPPAAPAAPTMPNVPAPPAWEPPDLPAEPIPLAGDHTMHDLFREEVRAACVVLSQGLPAFAADPTKFAGTSDLLDALNAVCGSARVMKAAPVEAAGRAVAAAVAAARDGRLSLAPPRADWLRFAADTIAGLVATDAENFPQWLSANAANLERAAGVLGSADFPSPLAGEGGGASPPGEGSASRPDSRPATTERPHPSPPTPPPQGERGAEPRPAPAAPSHAPPPPEEASVRVTAQSLNRLMGLAGESLVLGRWLQPFSAALMGLRKRHDRLTAALDALAQSPAPDPALLADARRLAAGCRQELTDHVGEFDDHAARAEDLNTRLYREVIVSRMRPFADGAHGFPRLVRDMARTLNKQAKLEVLGPTTEVDRDILERLEAPLSHLIRNAVDHGLEPPAVRAAAGKPEAGTVRLEARHRAGMLSVTVSDDGGGIDPERLRRKVVERGLNSVEMAAQLTEAELLEFLFLPGFSTASAVSEYSGRGVGLDVVHDTVRRVGGSVRVSSQLGRGTTFHLQLPITLSVIRAVVVEIAGEPYAFPHTRIDRLLRVPRDDVRSVEHRQFVAVDGQNVGLVVARQVLDLPPAPPRPAPDFPVVLLSDPTGAYGLVVDAFRGEQDLVVRPLDPRLGKVPNLSAAAILDDGAPVLIVDVEDLVRSMDQFIQAGSLHRVDRLGAGGAARRKRVLVVDDSITVREVERQLLQHQGYDVAVAVDGVDGWNKVRGGDFDLLVTDVDMPRMTGLQLVQAVRGDDRLKTLPAVIVSYKEREEDRLRGLEVGANAYLTKSSFHDNRFLRTVAELIGDDG